MNAVHFCEQPRSSTVGARTVADTNYAAVTQPTVVVTLQ
jgi:hypothetical protein